MRIHSVLFILLIAASARAQSSKKLLRYAHNIIDTLSSENFAGRGYNGNGIDKAADFIADKFDKYGLKKIGISYYQNFTMPVNMLLSAQLKLNDSTLSYGKDFIVSPNSFNAVYQHKEISYFHPEEMGKAFASKENIYNFFKDDLQSQKGKHVVFPPYHFKEDSLNQYYKQWPFFYPPEDNSDRAIFYFTNDSLPSSISTFQDSIAEFIIRGKYYNDSLKINNYSIETKFVPAFPVHNIIGEIEGKNKDSLVVISAHYDHLGKVGNAYFPGANDNASGVAFLLSMAKYYSRHKPKNTLIFLAFTGEEASLVGSGYFVNHPLINLNKIKMELNFDMIGTGDDGIQIVNSTIYTKAYDLICAINNKKHYVKQILPRGEAANSDHYSFYAKGIPSVYTYTLGGVKFYHDIWDRSETLPLTKFADIQKLFIKFINKL
ncbi:MAG: M28 family peptidase [Arachidicoccus sp.]|nr:M28 family peptidase [Arachidicoccus sp.]